MPGLVSEHLAVNPIPGTLEATVRQVQRLKILIHGQEVETRAGHLDLGEAFVVNTKPIQPPVKPAPAQTSPVKPATPASDKAPAPAPGPLTADKPPGKLAQPERKP